jgi:hypothetical protein
MRHASPIDRSGEAEDRQDEEDDDHETDEIDDAVHC